MKKYLFSLLLLSGLATSISHASKLFDGLAGRSSSAKDSVLLDFFVSTVVAGADMFPNLFKGAGISILGSLAAGATISALTFPLASGVAYYNNVDTNKFLSNRLPSNTSDTTEEEEEEKALIAQLFPRAHSASKVGYACSSTILKPAVLISLPFVGLAACLFMERTDKPFLFFQKLRDLLGE